MVKKRTIKSPKRAIKKKTERPELEMLVACDMVAPDPNTGKPSLYGVFDKFLVAKYPAEVTFFLYAKLRGGTGKHPFKFDVIGPDGNSVMPEKHNPVELEAKAGKKSQVVMRVAAAKVPKKGIYRVVGIIGRKIMKPEYLVEATLIKAK